MSSRSDGDKELGDSFSGQRGEKKCFISVGGQNRHPGSGYVYIILLKSSPAAVTSDLICLCEREEERPEEVILEQSDILHHFVKLPSAFH